MKQPRNSNDSSRLALDLDSCEERMIDEIGQLDSLDDIIDDDERRKLNEKVDAGTPSTWGAGENDTDFAASHSAPDSRSLPYLWNEKYELQEHLGGGMSQVFRASQMNLGRRDVVIKILPDQSTKARARFDRESHILGRLSAANSPHFVTVLEHARVEGMDFIAMEHVVGSTLKDVLIEGDERLDVQACCEIIRQAALGLTTAHDLGVIHRDVKPSNIMLTPNGVVKLIDFGVANQEEAEAANPITSSGVVPGTKSYMSPEQLSGHPVDARTDIYSLGLVFGELLEHVNSDPGVRRRREWQTARRIAARMTARNSEERCQNADEIVEALTPIAAKSGLRWDHALAKDRPLPKRELVAWVLAIAAGILFGGLFLSQAFRDSVFSALASFDRRTPPVVIVPETTHPPRRTETPTERDEDSLTNRQWVEAHGGKHIVNAAQHLVELLLPSKEVNDDDLRRFSGERSLVRVNLERTMVVGPGLQWLPKKLDKLMLTGTPITDDSVSVLEGRHVAQLSLGQTAIGDRGIASICKVQGLKKLSLNHCGNITDDALAMISRELKELEDLEILSTNVTDEGIAVLSDLPSLRNIDLSHTGVGDQGVANLPVQQIEELWLVNTLVTDKFTTNLRGSPNMRKLYLTMNPRITDAAISDIATLANLESLDASYTAITQDGLEKLKNLEYLKALSVLGLSTHHTELRRIFPKVNIRPSRGRLRDQMSTVFVQRTHPQNPADLGGSK